MDNEDQWALDHNYDALATARSFMQQAMRTCPKRICCIELAPEQGKHYEWCAEQLFTAGLIPEATVPALAAYALDKIQGLIGEYIAISLLGANRYVAHLVSDAWRVAGGRADREKVNP